MESAHLTGIASVPTGELFFQLAHHSPQPMLITNEHADIQYVNPAWERQFGFRLSEVRDQNPRILKSGRTPPEVHKRMWESLKSGQMFQTKEVIDKRKDGSFFNLRSTVFPVQTGDTLHYVQILDDITNEKSTLEFQKLYIRAAAHDIRTPLQSLRLITDIALLEREDPNVRDMQTEIARADTMMSELLDTTQFEAGEIVLRRSAFDIGALIREVVLGRPAYHGTVALEFESAVNVNADRNRIAQVLTNLIENALKYGGGKEPVRITLSQQNDLVVVSVSDKGPGIPMGEQDHLF